MNSSEPFISNDLFISYSDIVLIEKLDHNIVLKDIFNIFENKKSPIIFFINTDLIEYYSILLQNMKISFIIITTCNDDICVPYIYYPCPDENFKMKMDKILENPYLIKWVTKNPCIFHEKLHPIPLGPKWQYNSRNFFGEDKEPILKILNKHCLTPYENFANKELKTELLYFNFSQNTTIHPFIKEHTNMRKNVYDICIKNGFAECSGNHFEQYLIDLKKYKFCISPPGRGVDTHRTWESLMVGTIPIVLSSHLNSLFENLPVIIVDDWNDITPLFLEKSYEEIQKKKYDFSSLYSSFWKNVFIKTN